jgi:hypothetical protein
VMGLLQEAWEEKRQGRKAVGRARAGQSAMTRIKHWFFKNF